MINVLSDTNKADVRKEVPFCRDGAGVVSRLLDSETSSKQSSEQTKLT